MKNTQKFLEFIRKKGRTTSREMGSVFGVTRQYISMILSELIMEGEVVKIGGTRNAFYVSKEYSVLHPDEVPVTLKKRYKNEKLEEHVVLLAIEDRLPGLRDLPENVRSIFTFAFSEMLNNAIEHSGSKVISVEVNLIKNLLLFTINDSGIGVFRNIMQKKNLHSEIEAVQDLLKGKTTTMPRTHSGEGIFFTSKAGDGFTLHSFGQILDINNLEDFVSPKRTPIIKRGTSVSFSISVDSKRHLDEVFRKYTNITGDSDFGFDKTEIRVKLYTAGGVHISRSQARRILAGLEKFKVILFDYENVPLVGQAFADEIYRVFQERYPDIRLDNENMSEAVKFMVERAKNEAKRKTLLRN